MKNKLESLNVTVSLEQKTQDLCRILDEKDIQIAQGDYVFSEYLGKITIYNPDVKILMHDRVELNTLDLYLEKSLNRFRETKGCEPSSISSLKAFRYLNRNGGQFVTATNKTTFFEVFKELVDPEQLNTTKNNAPRLVFTSSQVIAALSPSRLYSLSLEDGTLLIAVDKALSFDRIVTSILYEIQWFYTNAIPYFDEEWNLSTSVMNEFIAFVSTLKPDCANHELILKDFQVIMSEYSDVKGFSAHLSGLLFKYTEDELWDSLEFLLESVGLTNSAKALEAILELEKALTYTFETRNQWAMVLFRFFSLHAKEFIYSAFEEEENVEAIKGAIIQLNNEAFDERNTALYWKDILDKVHELEWAMGKLFELTDINGDDYLLHTLVEEDNAISATALLQLGTNQINQSNSNGYAPLAVALIHNNSAMFNLLLQFGASIDWEGEVDGVHGCSLLHLAAFSGSFELIPVLLTLGLNASQLNKKNQPPITMLAKWLDNSASNEYPKCLYAMAQLLGQSQVFAYQCKDSFHNELELFRRNVSMLYVLSQKGALRKPEDILEIVVFQLGKAVFYYDLFKMLRKHPKLFQQFIKIGFDVLCHELKCIKKLEINIMYSFRQFITWENPLIQSADPEETKSLLDYYTPRSNRVAATSLAGVTLAQKQMRITSSTSFFNKEKYRERRTLIQRCKEEVVQQKEGGLVQVLLQAFKELGVHTLSTTQYHHYARVLDQLIIKEKRTHYAAPQFLEDFKHKALEAEDLVIKHKDSPTY